MIAGSCVEISSEICADKVSGTVITLISVTDPNGNIITLNTVMDFGTDDNNTNIAYATYQLDPTSPIGRWKFLIQSNNGGKINLAEGYFLVEDQ